MQSIICCDFWAKSFYLVSKLTLSSKEPTTSMSPLLALSRFLIEQSPTLYGHSQPNNPTIRMLYRLAKECLEQETEKDQCLTDVVDVICSNNEKLLHKIEASLNNVTGTSKAKNIVSSALEFNRLAKRKYVIIEDSDTSLEALPSRSFKKTTSENFNVQEDIEFIINYRKEKTGKMNWKHYLALAREKKLCQRFSTVEGIRSFFYHATKK
ncbi:MAG: hypothetical protein EXX96DRAFT_584566 [Benjaminiella poitrasii]|nr:MAG: hypothetical protein EXX96DRAFT_584566 [Benjaminiella poitrasii]